MSQPGDQLETLSNKELRAKCLEYGMNVPVADSSRDVIIRKLRKSMGASPVASPKTGRKQNVTGGERRQTINVTVLVDDEEKQQQRGNKAKASPRTQSPRGQANNVNNNRQNVSSTVQLSKTTTTAPVATKTGSILKSPDTERPLKSERAGNAAGGKNVRIVPMDVDLGRQEADDYNIEVRRSGSSSAIANDSNYNNVRTSKPAAAYQQPTPSLSTLNYTRQEPTLQRPSLYSQTAPTISPYTTRTADSFGVPTATTREPFVRQPVGLSKSTITSTSYNAEEHVPKATLTSGSFIGSPTFVAPEPVFKQPFSLAKSNVTNSSYNQAEAKRLYPRLPTDTLPATPTQPPRSARAGSLSKSGVLTTSYTQELSPTPVRELHENMEPIGDGDFLHTASGYDRTKYLSSMHREQDRTTIPRLPFEPQLQSTFRDSLGASARHSAPLLERNSYVSPSAATKTDTSMRHYSPSAATPRAHSTIVQETTTISDEDEEEEEPVEESFIDSDDDASIDDYAASSPPLGRSLGSGRTTSSYGGTQIYERVPLRRSHTTKLSAPIAPTRYSGYQQSPLKRHPLDADEDDVDASFKQFMQTVERKYHVKQILFMFAVFSLAVFVYVFFLQQPLEA